MSETRKQESCTVTLAGSAGGFTIGRKRIGSTRPGGGDRTG